MKDSNYHKLGHHSFFTLLHLCVCLYVCLSVTKITVAIFTANSQCHLEYIVVLIGRQPPVSKKNAQISQHFPTNFR